MTQNLIFSNLYSSSLLNLPSKKITINTLNAHCYNLTQKDKEYKNVLLKSDILLPDGISVVGAFYFLTGKKIKKIAGEDLFFYEMKRINDTGGKCFFLGSSEDTLKRIKKRAWQEYPRIVIETYSPPYKTGFTEEENREMINAVSSHSPDVLFIGMTAPKQEKWALKHFNELKAGHVCCIGAVFDFYAGTVSRAPKWMINLGFEWLYRLKREPRRMWRRYIIGNVLFIYYILREKILLMKINASKVLTKEIE